MDSNQPNIAEIISAAGTLVTAVFAGIALYGWKDQRKYELRMDALSKSRLAIDLIKQLRNGPTTERRSIDSILVDINHYNSVLKSERELYVDILKFNEMLWASFGEKHSFTKFFTEVIDIIRRIEIANTLKAEMSYVHPSPEGDLKVDQAYKITNDQGENDHVMLNLEKLHKAMIMR